jgi:hypothetical protein
MAKAKTINYDGKRLIAVTGHKAIAGALFAQSSPPDQRYIGICLLDMGDLGIEVQITKKRFPTAEAAEAAAFGTPEAPNADYPAFVIPSTGAK